MAFKLPHLYTWQSTFTRWANELKAALILTVASTLVKQWEPTFSNPTATMSWALSSVASAYYVQIGYLVFFWIHATGTTSGAGYPILTRFTLPVEPETDVLVGGRCLASGWTQDGSTAIGAFGYLETTNTISVLKSAGTNYGIGATRRFSLSGFYIAKNPTVE